MLTIVDAFMTPDISEGGPAAEIYRVTFWMGVALLSVLVMVQLGVAAFKRNGESVARLLIGVAQFVVVWAAWISYAGVVIAGAGGLTTALLQTLLGVDTWAAWQPTEAFSTEDITDGTLATVLGFMGLFLWLASIGHFIVMLARAAALMVLVATAPISAAGLSTELGRPWFWKSLRWFHAAAFAPVLMVLVLGIGVQITTGVVTGQADALSTTVGTAIPGVFLICIGCFAPLALFKLLAFVDPGTSSGAAMRTGLAGVGGFQGLMSSGGGGGSGTSSAASSTDDQGRSQAEVSGESDTSARTAKATGGLISTAGAALGPVGAGVGVAVATGLGAMVSAGTKGAVIGADVTNQMGVGSNTYVPDFAGGPGRRRGFVQNGEDGGGAEDFDPDDGDTQAEPGGRPVAPMPPSPGKDGSGGTGQTPPTPPPPGPGGAPPGASGPPPGPAPSGGTSGAGAAADAGAAGGAGAGAAVVPPV